MNQEQAFELAMKGENIFLTGNAGTGKTYTLNKIIRALRESGKIVAVTASTGIASTHINGTTIHSWAGIGIKDKLTQDDLFKIKNNKWSRERIANADVLVIDEISMLHGFRLNLVEEVCRFVRNPHLVFGGLQVIVSGDFFQLPPVNKDNDGEKHYCFNSHSWKTIKFKTCYLQKIYRQANDRTFIDILNNIRKNKVTKEQKAVLDELSENTYNNDMAVNLFCKNINVDRMNAQELHALHSEPFISRMECEGLDWKVDQLKKNCLAAETLILKKGAKVMIIVNDFGKQNPEYVNGTLGEVIDISMMNDEDHGYVKIKVYKTGKEITIGKVKWEMTEYSEQARKDVVVACIRQYPIKLAWAITVHKSQGATFDYVNLDLSDVFIENMGYVALSRVTSLEGLYLEGYNSLSLKIDEDILIQDQLFLSDSENNELLFNPVAKKRVVEI